MEGEKLRLSGDLAAPGLIEDKVKRRIPNRQKSRVFRQLREMARHRASQVFRLLTGGTEALISRRRKE
jgi:hypothetical protein